MERAIFLDRDGVINKERGTYTYRTADFAFVPGITSMLQKWQSKHYLLIIVTNQSGIAKGIYSHQHVQDLHAHMLEQLKKQQVSIHDIYYCPHHPSQSKCLCRKPGSLLFEKAIARYHIEPQKSYIIGDKRRDMEAGARVGLQTIKVEPNTNLTESHLSIV